MTAQKDFRSTIPSGGNVVCEQRSGFLVRLQQGSRQSKVCHFRMTLCVEQDVGRFQVSVKDLRRVHIFETLENLIDYVPFVNVLKNVGFDDSVEVRLHEIENQVDVLVVLGPDDVQKLDDVLMTIKFLQEDDLSEGSLSVCGVLERIEHLLESTHSFALLVDDLPDDSICALTHFLLDLILLQHMVFYFVSHD